MRMLCRTEDAEPAGGRAQPTVNFDCQSWLTTPMEHASSKSAGGEHVPPVGVLGELTPAFGMLVPVGGQLRSR